MLTPAAVEHRDEGGALRAALATLKPADRDVLVMASWDGLPVKDIAVLLGVTPNAVSLRLHKARRRLAEALEKDAGGRRTSTTRCPLLEGNEQ